MIAAAAVVALVPPEAIGTGPPVIFVALSVVTDMVPPGVQVAESRQPREAVADEDNPDAQAPPPEDDKQPHEDMILKKALDILRGLKS